MTINSAIPFPYFFKGKGEVLTVAVMFAFRYGFLKDRELPFGRLQPYVAVGQAVMLTRQEPIFTANSAVIPNLSHSDITINPGKSTYGDIILTVEAGMRWMALKKVSMDLSIKYRRAPPLRIHYIEQVFQLAPLYEVFSRL